MSMAAVKAVEAACDAAEDRDGLGIVLLYLSGAPEAFQPGQLNVGLVTKWERTLRRLERVPRATVAVVSGNCGGAALDVLLASDFRIATPDVRLLIAVDDEATWPGMTLYRLAQQVGIGRIRRPLLLGTPIEASDALRLQLIDELADDPATALAIVTELTWEISGSELAIRRQLMFDANTTSFEDALGSHLAACDRAIRRASVETPS
jgi:isomerase DpgB